MRLTTILCLATLSAGAADAPDPAAARAAAKAELARTAQEARKLSRSFELTHEIVGPSVLSIHTSRNEKVYIKRGANLYEGVREVEAGEGSGFVFASDEKGSYVLTNSHVVLQTEDTSPQEFARVTAVLNDGRETKAEYVAFDLASDLAVMRIDVPLPAIDWADSDQARVGDWVVALGFPLGVGYSATAGIISATDRSTGIYQAVGGFESFIQTDAAINRGNSGGPLVTIDGTVVGVNAMIVSPTGSSIGLGFAIPSNLARRVAEDLVAHKKVVRPQIGVYLDEVPPDEAKALGLPGRQTVRIADLLPGAPADAAGIKRHDVILAVNGVPIVSVQQFRARIASLRIEAPIELALWRDGKRVEARVQPVSQEALEEAAKKQVDKRRGVPLRAYGLTLGVDDKPGLVVTGVVAGEAADVAGLAEGDRVLLEREVGELDSLEDARALANRPELTLQVVKKGRSLWIRLRRLPGER